MMTNNEMIVFFEENGFNVDLINEYKRQCAEIEKWTNGGVDMIIYLNPFTVEEFEKYVNDFDVDELIDMHRQDDRYKKAFTISQSLIDFTNFHNHLINTKNLLLKKAQL